MAMSTVDNTNTVEFKNGQLRISCSRSALSDELITEINAQGLALSKRGNEFFLITHRIKQSDEFWLQLAGYIRQAINAK